MRRLDSFPTMDGELTYANLDSIQITEMIGRFNCVNSHIKVIDEGKLSEHPLYIWYKKTLHIDEAGQLCLGPEVEVLLDSEVE